MDAPLKPKLVFFQHRSESNPGYIRLHTAQHVKCLATFFDLTVINSDCDYSQVCDEHQPHLALFESSVYPGRMTIRNASSHPAIPKLGLIHADAYCISRNAILSAMDNWGIETFFSIAVSMGEYVPDIASHLFVWPNCVDTAIYRDYGEPKAIPILLTGSLETHYPWRNRVAGVLSQEYPTFSTPHFGWSGAQTARMISGERYARLLNSAQVVPTCGTIAKEVVRKHFEIPASRSCLVTEGTSALAAAGFIDMVNCVFADTDTIVDKLDYLFANQDILQNITDAGHALVHSRHTIAQRDQILQWFMLRQTLTADQSIIQVGPFDDLTIIDRTQRLQNGHAVGPGVDRIILAEAERQLWAGHFVEAERLYLMCVNYHQPMPEPKLGLALCHLLAGNPTAALSWIRQPLADTLEIYRAQDPDPVEWAYFVVCLLCRGQLEEAQACADRFAHLEHIELARVRWLVARVTGRPTLPAPPDSLHRQRFSVHQLPHRRLPAWLGRVRDMLVACDQAELASRLDSSALNASPAPTAPLAPRSHNREQPLSVPSAGIRDGRWAYESPTERLRSGVNRWGTRLLNSAFVRRLEASSGYSLPYELVRRRRDVFLDNIHKLARSEEIRGALILGASSRQGATERFIAGILTNPTMPPAYCASVVPERLQELFARHACASTIRPYELTRQPDGSIDLARCIRDIRMDSAGVLIDLLLVDGSELGSAVDLEAIGPVKIVIIDDINTPASQDTWRKLSLDPRYTLVSHHPTLRQGCAIARLRTVDRSAVGRTDTPRTGLVDRFTGGTRSWSEQPQRKRRVIS